MKPINLCIIKPNKETYSETFIQQHIDRLPGNKKVLYGGVFPVYDDNDKYLMESKWSLLSYLVQKKILGKKAINVRTNALVRYLKQQQIDVVLAEYGMVGAMVAKACYLANVPMVIHFHGADAHHHKTVQIYRSLYKKAFAYASAIVAVSGDMVEALKKLGAPAAKIVLNPYGVDTARFTRIEVFGTPCNFMSVGRFVAKKSPGSVVRAFSIVADKIPDAKLWMVGEGPLFEETKQLASKLGVASKITFTGVLSGREIQKLMQQMRCFIQHSVTSPDGDMEGTPNTILEAGSSGLPVVSTFHAGIKQAVIHGKTGYLVPEHDIEGMAAYMIKLGTDATLAQTMGAAARSHIIDNYDIDKQIAKLNKIILSALN